MGQEPAYNNTLAGRAPSGRTGVSSSTVLFMMYIEFTRMLERLYKLLRPYAATQVFLESPRETFSLYSLLAGALTSSWRKIKNILHVYTAVVKRICIKKSVLFIK